MLQVKQSHTRSLVHVPLSIATIVLLYSGTASAQGYDDAFEMKNKLKVEVQYADYGEYEYPEPILYHYSVSSYQKIQPFIVNFPELRSLVKFVRLVDWRTALGIKYQYSDLKEDAAQHFAELRVTRNLSESVIGLGMVQFVHDTRGFSSIQGGVGGQWDINVLTSLQGDMQYYARGSGATAVGGSMGTWNLRIKARRVITISTALQGEYIYYNASGDNISCRSHTAGIWISQYLPTESAVHLHFRYYTNSMGIHSIAPSLEIAHYLDYATVLSLKLRYYENKSDNVSLGESDVIIPDGLRSRSLSLQLNREFGNSVLAYLKYRYYTSSLDVQMNTYMIGAVYSF